METSNSWDVIQVCGAVVISVVNCRYIASCSNWPITLGSQARVAIGLHRITHALNFSVDELTYWTYHKNGSLLSRSTAVHSRDSNWRLAGTILPAASVITCMLHSALNLAQSKFQTRWLYCVKFSQYSIRLEALGYLCTNCLLPAFDDA